MLKEQLLLCVITKQACIDILKCFLIHNINMYHNILVVYNNLSNIYQTFASLCNSYIQNKEITHFDEVHRLKTKEGNLTIYDNFRI